VPKAEGAVLVDLLGTDASPVSPAAPYREVQRDLRRQIKPKFTKLEHHCRIGDWQSARKILGIQLVIAIYQDGQKKSRNWVKMTPQLENIEATSKKSNI